MILKPLQIWCHTLNKKRTFKITGKVREICQSEKVETMLWYGVILLINKNKLGKNNGKAGKFVSPKKWKRCLLNTGYQDL